MQGLEEIKIKALLDGIIFEIFFDSQGEIRKDFKMSLFNKVFELKLFPEFAPSFEFISEILLNYQNRFYVIPGKSRDVTVDVSLTQNADDENIINGIYFEGFNILRESDDSPVMAFKGTQSYYPISFSKLKDQISKEMVVPLLQLTVNPTIDVSSGKILIPSYHTVSK